MKCQFHLLTYVDDGGLQMYLENFFNIYSHEFKMRQSIQEWTE